MTENRPDLDALEKRLRDPRLVGPLNTDAANAVAELREATRLMKPFASAAEKLDGLWDENDWRWNDSVRSNVTVRDIRAVSAFLARNGKGEGQ